MGKKRMCPVNLQNFNGEKMKHAHETTATELIKQGRAHSIQSAKRLQEISRLEAANDELLAALETVIEYGASEENLEVAKTAIAKAKGGAE